MKLGIKYVLSYLYYKADYITELRFISGMKQTSIYISTSTWCKLTRLTEYKFIIFLVTARNTENVIFTLRFIAFSTLTCQTICIQKRPLSCSRCGKISLISHLLLNCCIIFHCVLQLIPILD